MDAEESHIKISFKMDILPMEVLEKVFDFLGFEDRRMARYTCKRWNEILSFKRFICNEVFVFFSPQRQHFAHEASRKFLNVKIDSYEIDDRSLEFLRNIGKDAKAVEVVSNPRSFLSHQLKSVLGCFPNIENLILLIIPDIGSLEFLLSFKCLKHVHFQNVSTYCRIDPRVTSCLKKFNEVSVGKLQLSKGDVSEQQRSFVNVSEEVMEKHKPIFSCLREIYPSRNFNVAKELFIQKEDVDKFIFSRESDLADLVFFPNLHTATFPYHHNNHEFFEYEGERGCCYNCFSHNPVVSTSITSVQIANKTCLRCLKFLADSCPNATSWMIENLNRTSFAQVPNIFINIEFLDCSGRMSNLEEIFESAQQVPEPCFLKLKSLQGFFTGRPMWPPLPSLIELRVSGFHFNFEELTAVAPSMRSFKTLDDIFLEDLKIMATKWPYLKDFDARKLKGQFSKEDLNDIFRKCRNLVRFSVGMDS